MQNKLNDCFPSCLIPCCFTIFRQRPLNREPLRFVLFLTLAAKMLKLYSFNPLLTMNTTVFQETSNLYYFLEPIIGRLFQKLILGRSLRSSFIDPFSFARANAATLRKVLAPFSFSHVIDYCSFLLFLVLFLFLW